MDGLRVVLFVTLVVWGIGLAVGLALYGLDWLAGWLHRRRARKRNLRLW